MNQTGFESQFSAFLDVMTRPEGVCAIAVMIAMIIAVLASKSFKWVVLTLALYTATFSFVLTAADRTPISLLPGFEQIRAHGRPICAALLVVLVLRALLPASGWRQRSFNIGAVTLLFFQLALAFRITMDETSRGIASFVIYPLIFIPLGIGLNRWLQEWKDVDAMLRCLVGVAVLQVLGTAIHLALAYSVVVHGRRLYGTAGNPQMVAALLAGVIPTICYFIVRPGQRAIWRLTHSAFLGFLIIMLLWAGSRTGIVMALVGLAFFFRGRFGRLAISGAAVAIFVLLAMQIYTESTATFSEMFLRGDTRSHVWVELLQQFRDHVAWGVMGEEFGARENSYLTVAANTGLFGAIPMLLFLLVTGWQLFRLQRVRRLLGPYSLLADLATSGLVALATACVFEGFICGTLTFQVFSCYMYLALVSFLLDAAKAMAAQRLEVAEPAALTDEGYDYSYQPGLPQPQPLEIG